MDIKLYSEAEKYLSECGNKCMKCEFRLNGDIAQPGWFVTYVESNDISNRVFKITTQCAPLQIVARYKKGWLK